MSTHAIIKTVVANYSKNPTQGRIYLTKEWISERVAIVRWSDFERLLNVIERLRFSKSLLEHVLNRDAQGRKMFSFVTRTWNPVTGCTHNCRYCWARRLAETKLRNKKRYSEGFRPRLNEGELKITFNDGEVVFVSDMGDLFNDYVRDEWIRAVLDCIRRFPRTYFLLLTKNPFRYRDFLDEMPFNVLLGATIETDRDDFYHEISQAPPPSRRLRAMRDLKWRLKFVSVEPALDFSDDFAHHLLSIEPVMVYVGYDNYDNRLPEPPLNKVENLIHDLSQADVVVVKKTIRPAWYEGLAKYLRKEGSRCQPVTTLNG